MLHQRAIQTPLLNLAKQSDVIEDSALLVPRNPKPNFIYSRPSIGNLFWRTTLPASAMAATAKTVKDVPSHEFVRAYAAHLKKSGKINVPTWVDIVKTATFKELAPYDPDWYYIRTASMARKIYLRHGIGLGAFRKIYGGRKSNGVRPSHFAKSSGAIARSVLKQLETLDIINKDPKGGRRITSSGQRDLDQVAGRIAVAPA